MRRRTDADRPPMPDWVLAPRAAEREDAQRWRIANGWPLLEWLLDFAGERQGAKRRRGVEITYGECG